MTKGRWALLELGRTRPDVIDSGVVAWNEERYGPDEGRVKMRLSFKTQVNSLVAVVLSWSWTGLCQAGCMYWVGPLSVMVLHGCKPT